MLWFPYYYMRFITITLQMAPVQTLAFSYINSWKDQFRNWHFTGISHVYWISQVFHVVTLLMRIFVLTFTGISHGNHIDRIFVLSFTGISHRNEVRLTISHGFHGMRRFHSTVKLCHSRCSKISQGISQDALIFTGIS